MQQAMSEAQFDLAIEQRELDFDAELAELARLPPPGPITRKLLLQQSYPIVDDDGGEEMPCFGP